ncbi:fumarylacetoacetate hydrolase family protein [Nocardioides sp. S5]|uniref:fumarylacetoacetate hydrolase family protein n=1 Tax=Nocardioides sp. S5 TaxID=2017486 RepID=UPI001F5D84B4|nr:fumarylacetoacetate hydrolase family protein [Nocardioides sp. S5]
MTTPGGSTAAAWRDGWRRLPASDLSAYLRVHTTADAHALAGDDVSDAVPTLLLPSPGKVICCGLNYGDHIAETGRERPTYPTLFAKFADTLIGPDDTIDLPADVETDWEAELAVVVGAELRNATQTEAQAGIAGYTIANDISIRDWQRRTLQWFQGKAWDATTPLGPVLVTPDEIDPKDGVEVVCRVNGIERQRGNTRTLVFDCPALLSYISTFTTLRPGDVVLTGTPGGVGMAMDPPTYLTGGDTVETEIDGIGMLTNHIRTGA